MYEVNPLWQEGLNLRIRLARQILRATDGSVNPLHNVLQEGHRTVLLADHGLPVPLVYVERVQVVQFLVGTYGVHVRIDAVARLNLILSQREPLPLGQRVHHLGLSVAEILDGECHCPLNTVQVIVDAQPLQHEERRRHATQPEFRRQVLLEELLNQLDALLRLPHVEQRFIVYRFDNLSHIFCLCFILAAKVSHLLQICKQNTKYFRKMTQILDFC